MSAPSQIIPAGLALLVLFSVVCGCVSSSIGDVSYTNGGQFCYQGVFQVEGGTDSTKVFLSYDHDEDRVIADYQLTEW
jgi:hypothetical protein